MASDDMLLGVVVVQNDDVQPFSDALNRAHFTHTQIETAGGFLLRGNTTVLVGVSPHQVERLIDIVTEHCRSRMATVVTPLVAVMEATAAETVVEIPVGGATAMFVPVERIERI